MGVSGQRHAPAALLPPGKGPPVPIVQEAGWDLWVLDYILLFYFKTKILEMSSSQPIIIIISGCTILLRTLVASHRRFRNLVKTHVRTPLDEWSARRIPQPVPILISNISWLCLRWTKAFLRHDVDKLYISSSLFPRSYRIRYLRK
jgi:hypothetical protein